MSGLPKPLRMRNVTRVYGSGANQVIAVDDVSLDVDRGEILLLMGPSGSGKTTLLTMAGGLLRPTSGAIEIEGQDVTLLPDSELSLLRRNKIGFIFQSFNLLSAPTAMENVEIVMNFSGKTGKDARDKARTLLTEFGLGARIHFRPEQLSGGEKQRVSIARALANDPSLILADEPTANLDSRRGHEVMEILRDVARRQGKTVVIVSHDHRIRDVADRVVWLEDGQLKDIGAVVHDPVCGMALEAVTAAAFSVHKGERYYFCAPGCKKVFDADPETYLARSWRASD